ncbi:MAG: hypothetical protein M0008_06710 [Actinomycetota bacterium]|jgi:flavodoxin|nr:hypothetical protein [Actinomycetota bacterium]
MKTVLVGYESRGGKTKQAADAVAEACRSKGHDVTVKPLSEVRQDALDGADVVFIGSWVDGFVLFGVQPAKAARTWFQGNVTLTDKTVALFCTYAFNPRSSLATMRSLAEAKGAKVVAERAMNHRSPADGAGDLVAAVPGL